MAKKQIVGVMKWIFMHRKYVLRAWGLFLVVLAYSYFFHKAFLFTTFESFFVYPLAGYLIYFVVVSLRGLTFIPLTTFLFVMLPFTDPWILFVLTMIGTLITSYIIYRFSQALSIDTYFQDTYPRMIKKLRRGFSKYELPVIILRSLIPFTPTDLICYIAGTLNVSLRKMLFGIGIGEGMICAVYIWGLSAIVG